MFHYFCGSITSYELTVSSSLTYGPWTLGKTTASFGAANGDESRGSSFLVAAVCLKTKSIFLSWCAANGAADYMSDTKNAAPNEKQNMATWYLLVSLSRFVSLLSHQRRRRRVKKVDSLPVDR
jgi:hypothetical protein